MKSNCLTVANKLDFHCYYLFGQRTYHTKIKKKKKKKFFFFFIIILKIKEYISFKFFF